MTLTLARLCLAMALLAGSVALADDDLESRLVENLPGSGQTTAPSGPPSLLRGAGEDIGQPPADDDPYEVAMQDIEALMARAHQLLRDRKTAMPTQQAQQSVLQQLDELITAIEAAQKQQSSSRPGGQADGTGGLQRTDDPQNAQSGQDGSTAADKLASTPPAGLERVWGHLPERLREQMRSAGIERFLPEYEELIEAYYKRLAERPTVAP